MKKLISLAAIMLILGTGSIFAHESRVEEYSYRKNNSKKFSIQTDGIAIAQNVFNPYIRNSGNINFNLDFQYAFSRFFSFSFNNQLKFEKETNYDSNNNIQYNDFQTTYILNPAIVFHISGNYLRGFYSTLYPEIGFLASTSSQLENPYLILGCGTEIGYQWISKGGLTFNLGTGLKKKWYISDDYNVTTDDLNHFLPVEGILKMQIGFSF